MKKFLLFIILLIPLRVGALEINDIHSKYAIVFDRTSGQVIYNKNGVIPTSIASLTKLVTVMGAIEQIKDLDAQVMIKADMLEGLYWNASRAGLQVGDVVTYRDLLYATILPSGADAALVLAVSLRDSEDNFVEYMNEFAKNVGMNTSHFENTSGLDQKGQYSSCLDVAILLDYALNNEEFKEVFTTRSYVLSNGLKVNSTLENYQKKLGLDTKRILGSKSGTTDEAGLALASLVKIGDHEVLIVTVGAPLDDNYYNLVDHLNIINYLDKNYGIEEEVNTSDDIDEYMKYVPWVFLVLVICFLGTDKREIIKWLSKSGR